MKPGASAGGYREELRTRFRGALVGAVVGDALGAPFEGYPHQLSAGQLDGVTTAVSELRYTDDTALTHALAESLIARGSLDLDHLAGRFSSAYSRDPHRGYGAGAAHLLERVAAGEDWRGLAANQFGGRGSFGNGAAMRVAPVALLAYPAVNRAVSMGRSSASVTHTHPEAIDAAGIQAAAVALALTTAAGVDRFAVDHLLSQATTPSLRKALRAVAQLKPSSTAAQVAAVTGTGIRAVEAVPAALAAVLLNMQSFSATVRFAITLGGDTDTIASMAGAIAGARLGEQAIPTAWRAQVEGARQAGNLADRLWMKKYGES
ncbi:MAG: ADP-ribosylglycohydrolase family protein [Actinomycetota bacterium]